MLLPAVGETRVISSTGAVLQSVARKVLIIGINILTGIITARALAARGTGRTGGDDSLAGVPGQRIESGSPQRFDISTQAHSGKAVGIDGGSASACDFGGRHCRAAGRAFHAGVDSPISAAGDSLCPVVSTECADRHSAWRWDGQGWKAAETLPRPTRS